MNNILITLKKDLRSTLRDTKSLSMMLMMPFLIPVVVLLFGYGFNQMANTEPNDIIVAVNYLVTEEKQAIFDELDLNVLEKSEEDLLQAYEDGEISAYVLFSDGQYSIYHNPNNQDSVIAAMELASYLEAYSNHLGANYLISRGIDPERVFHLVSYELEELESNNIIINTLISLAFTFTIISITTTAITSATDAIAGEKEKGTLETILTFPVNSSELIIGKYIANFLVSLVTMVLCIVLSLIALQFAISTFEVFEEVTMLLNTETLLLSFIILAGYTLLISGATIAIASYSKTFKEAQSALQPLAFIPMLPMFMSIAGVELTLLIAAIPGIGQAMLLEQLFVGNVDILYVIVMLISNLIFLVIVLNYIIKLYKSEKVLFSL